MKSIVVMANTSATLQEKINEALQGIPLNKYVDLKLTGDSGNFVAVIIYKG